MHAGADRQGQQEKDIKTWAIPGSRNKGNKQREQKKTGRQKDRAEFATSKQQVRGKGALGKGILKNLRMFYLCVLLQPCIHIKCPRWGDVANMWTENKI